MIILIGYFILLTLIALVFVQYLHFQLMRKMFEESDYFQKKQLIYMQNQEKRIQDLIRSKQCQNQ